MTDTLVGLLRASAEAVPGAHAIVHKGERVAYAELWMRATALGRFLRESGLDTGARVALLVENSSTYAAAYYGVLLAGGVVVALNTATKARDLVNWIRHSGSNWLIAGHRHPELETVLRELRDEVRWIDTDVVDAGSAPVAHADWKNIVDDPGLRAELAGNLKPDDLAALIYTSGTTGRPKGVMLSHANLYANTRSILAYLKLTQADSIVNVLPFYYSYGNSVLHTHLAVGGRLVLENSLLYPHTVVAAMAEERVTGFSGVPSTYSLLLNRVKLADYDLASLRYLTQAGGPMAPANIERVRRELPHVQFFVMYGQTEASARLTYLPPEELDRKMGSIGIPIPDVSIRLVDEKGMPVLPGVVGEIQARGKNIMRGYWKDPQATAATVRDGWLHTGDLATRDEDGYLFIVGRSSDMIKSGANRISPKEIEEVILELDGVEEAVAVGIPDEILGQVIKVVIVRSPAAVLDQREVLRHCREHLASYKIPKIVEFAPDIPKTASGKVRRFMLQN